jgi:hypothetical protein
MSVIETTLASSRRLEMGMAGLLTLQSAGDVRSLLKEWHAGVAQRLRCASVVLAQQVDLPNLLFAFASAKQRDGLHGPKLTQELVRRAFFLKGHLA